MTALHVLDLHEDGYISRHVDSVKVREGDWRCHSVGSQLLTSRGSHSLSTAAAAQFSGDYIIGITLLSPTIMRLHEEGEDESDLGHEEKSYSGEEVTMLLEPRSLYVLRCPSLWLPACLLASVMLHLTPLRHGPHKQL